MNEEILEYIYRKYRKLVLDTAYSVLKDFYLAQDVCQEVFIKLSSKKIKLAEKPDQMKRFLIAVTYHRAIDYYRSIHAHGEVCLDDAESLVMNSDIEDKIDFEIFMAEMFKGLKEKNEEWHQIVLRVGFYDEPAEIVARNLGISINLLRTKYHRAKKWIRIHYESEYEFFKDT